MTYSYNPLASLGLDKSIPLDGAGKIPSDYLPSYVDDVVEYDDLASFPGTGETGKIYVAKDTGYTYRWTGSVYVRIGSGGDVALNLGSQGSPSLYFTGDPNTGIYSPGADQLALSTNGQGRVFINASGNVGVGAASPGALFSVGSTSSSSVNSTIASSATGDGGIYFYDGANAGAITYSHVSNDLYFRTNNSEKLRITSTGQLSHIGAGSVGSPAVSFNGSAPSNSLVVDSLGRVSIGTSSPGALLDLRSSGSPSLHLSPSGSPTDYRGYSVDFSRAGQTGGIDFTTSSPSAFLDLYAGGSSTYLGGWSGQIRFFTGSTNSYGAERARIDSSGRLLVGTSSARTDLVRQINVEGVNDGGITICRGGANNAPPLIEFGKTRSGNVGGVAAVLNGDQLGMLRFFGANGSTLDNEGARITAEVDGAVSGGGANDMPGRLVFSTTADGAASPTERLRITSAGVLQVADAGNIAVGTTTGTKIGTATTQKLGFFNATPVVQPAAVADATDAATVITQLNDLLAKLRTLGIIAT